MSITDLGFMMAYVVVLWVSVPLTRLADISLRRFSIPSFVICVYLLCAYIGILPLYFGWDQSALHLGVLDPNIIITMFIYSSISLLLMIGGFIFCRRALHLSVHSHDLAYLQQAQVGERLAFIALLVVSTSVLLLYLEKVSSIAVLVALEGFIRDAALSRNEMGTTFPGTYWRYRLFFGPLLQLCCLFFLADYRTSGRLVSGLLFFASLLAAGFASVMAIEKGPFLHLLLSVYLVYAVSRGGAYWQPKLKYVIVLIMVGIVLMYRLFVGITDVATALSGVVSRVLIGQIAASYFYIEIFPSELDYLHGASFPNPGGLFDFEPFELTKFISSHIYRGDAILGIVGSAPTAFWGEMHANFGPAGVLIPPFFVGVFIYAVQHMLGRLVLTPTTIAATIVIAQHYGTLAGTSLSSYLFDTTIFAVFLVTFTALATRRANWTLHHRRAQQNCDYAVQGVGNAQRIRPRCQERGL